MRWGGGEAFSLNMTRVSELWQSAHIPIYISKNSEYFFPTQKSLARALHIIERNALNKPLHHLINLNNNKKRIYKNGKDYWY